MDKSIFPAGAVQLRRGCSPLELWQEHSGYRRDGAFVCEAIFLDVTDFIVISEIVTYGDRTFSLQ